MSKTVEIQIEKSRGLIEGLRRHVREMGERVVSSDEINEMEQAIKMLEVANTEVDRLRGELTVKVKNMNTVMARVKESYAEKKKALKGYYPQERWDGLRRARQALTIWQDKNPWQSKVTATDFY